MNRILSFKRICCVIFVLIVLGLCGCTDIVQDNDTISEISMIVEQEPDTDPQNQEYTLLRIYYGFCRDDEWHIQPSEEYDLKSIFAPKQTTGYNAAGRSHLVKIGPYLLICVANLSYDDDPETTISCEITDTLGSIVEEPFSEYSTASITNTDGQQYGYVKKEGMSNIYVEHFFRHYYFLILDYAALPDDYVLECKFISTKGTTSKTLTYDDIVRLIEQ